MWHSQCSPSSCFSYISYITLVSGPVTVGARTSLPIDVVDFLFGNDLAGGKVVPDPVITDKPKIEEVIDHILEEIPDLYPSCTVSCAMTQKAKLSKSLITNSILSKYDLADSFFFFFLIRR